MRHGRAIAAVVLAVILEVAGAAEPPGPPTPSFADLSLEELSQVEITSVSRRAERLGEAAASVYVITGEDIRRSGATSLAEALRLAPNLQVARVDSAQYAISARGFNNAIGNKLLVLIDGRTIYAPFFSGVLWDQQDVMLEDVERIEVISGPGGTLWGTNAVNGVINVVTRAATHTQGALAVVRGGNDEVGAALRYGAAFGTQGQFRVFAKSTRLQNTETASGAAQLNGWDRHQIGFRADWSEPNGGFMLQGSALDGKTDARPNIGPFYVGALETFEANLVGQWTRRLADGSDFRVQAYYDRSRRRDRQLYQPQETVVDLEFQHAMPLGAHRLLWGGGHRRARDTIDPGFFFGFVPASRSLNWSNVFVQGEARLGRSVDLTLGTRVERNGYTGTEVLPSARLAWKLSGEQMLWMAASRAVRAPARLDRDIRLPPVAAPTYLIAGGPNFVSEVANVYEIGYKTSPSRDLSLSVTAFRQDWSHLRSGQTPPNAQVQNMIEGDTSGIEAWAVWRPLRSWRLSAGASTLHKDLRLQAGSTDPDGPRNLGNDPEFQWKLRSAFNLTEQHELDVDVRRVGALPAPVVPAYTAVDLRYGWRINGQVDVSLVARNLFDAGHPEFGGAVGRSEIGRSALLQLRWTL